jgi:hypothetical protein
MTESSMKPSSPESTLITVMRAPTPRVTPETLTIVEKARCLRLGCLLRYLQARCHDSEFIGSPKCPSAEYKSARRLWRSSMYLPLCLQACRSHGSGNIVNPATRAAVIAVPASEAQVIPAGIGFRHGTSCRNIWPLRGLYITKVESGPAGSCPEAEAVSVYGPAYAALLKGRRI